jgi:hypothetical protein
MNPRHDDLTDSTRESDKTADGSPASSILDDPWACYEDYEASCGLAAEENPCCCCCC